MLVSDDSVFVWNNYLKKYKLFTISEIEVTNAALPIPWISLIILGMFGAFIIRKRHDIKSVIRKKWWTFLLLMIVVLLFFPIQYDLEIPYWKKEMFSTPEAEELLGELLKNTYRAFDFREESDIYDKLAISNEGELLSEVYLQTKKSMVIENQGGIQAKVKEISVLDVVEVDSDKPGLAYECQWRVGGTVGHWGHIHRRTNQYRAIVNIIPVSGVWKMNGLDIIEEIRL